MPYIITNTDIRRGIKTGSLSQYNYSYRYPMQLKLKPGTRLHDKIRDEVLERAQVSRDALSNRFDSWNEIDQKLTGYIDISVEEERVREKDSTKPMKVVVPLSYAAKEVILAYMTAVFLDDPIFRYVGVDDRDTLGAMLLEMLVSQQVFKSKMGLSIYSMMDDAIKYGVGLAAPMFERNYGFSIDRDSNTRNYGLKWEGNRMVNVSPYNWFPDPYQSVDNIQHSEFQGWLTTESVSACLTREKNDSNYFNGLYLKHIDGRSVFGFDESERDRDSVRPSTGRSVTSPVDIIWMCVDLIPDEWGLGRYKYPEKWIFGVAGDSVIIKAQPLQLDHGMFPIVACAPTTDGNNIAPISLLETTYGLQNFVDFLYNSHIVNTRKMLNDMFVVDPETININDLKNPAPGKIIRTRKRVWGQGVKGAVEQLKVEDVTRGNVMEALSVSQVINMAIGAPDVLQGAAHKGERISAHEYQGTKSAALARLEKMAKIASMQSMQDLAYMVASHTQQFMSKEQIVRISENYANDIAEEYGTDVRSISISPSDINIDFDIIVQNGTLPNVGSPEIWATIFQIVTANPELTQKFDTVRIFKHLAKLDGARNVKEFERKVQTAVKPDEEVVNQADKGNILPMEAMSA